MFPAKSLIALVAVALTIGGSLATPIHSQRGHTAANAPGPLKFSTRFNLATGERIADVDRARAKALYGRGVTGNKGHVTAKRANSSSSVSVTNNAVTYVASVGVGSPATDYNLLIDTGSSNTWVGAGQAYKKTSTSQSTGNSVTLSYGSGSMQGTEYTDTVTLSSGLVITGQSIGVASKAQDFNGLDGILGIGPTDLTQGTVQNTGTVPTVTDNLYKQGTISTEVVGIFYAPATSTSDANGELTFGGTDSSKYSGEVQYVPLTGTSPASEYWGIDEEVSYGGTQILGQSSGIVDTGTTLILLETSAYQAYLKAVGGQEDQTTGLISITQSQYEQLSSLDFIIGGNTYSLSSNAQIWPRSLNSQIGGQEGSIYLVVSDLGSLGGSGLDFINGYTFLERYYSVFDTTNKQVGFAVTSYTNATTN